MLRATAGAPSPGGVDEQTAFERHRRFAAGVELDHCRRRLGAQQRRVKGKGRAGFLGVAAQRQHVGVAVDDAGGRREQRGVAVQRRLQRARGFARERLHVEHAVGLGMGADRLQLLGLLRRGRDDQLAAIAMRDAVIAAIVDRARACR